MKNKQNILKKIRDNSDKTLSLESEKKKRLTSKELLDIIRKSFYHNTYSKIATQDDDESEEVKD